MTSCRVCGSDRIEPLADAGSVPVQCTALYDDAEAARGSARGEMRLVLCLDCTAVTNAAFDPGLVVYDAEYENSQLFSGTFRRYAEELAARLVADHDLTGRHVVEVGSGKGEFLAMLVDAGLGRATGYDPTYGGEVDDLAPTSVVRIERTLFDETTVGEAPDLVCLRHVLEHLDEPVGALQAIHRATTANPACVLYVEVPDARFTFTEPGLWDIIYQHCSYFTPVALRDVLGRAGFGAVSVHGAFGGQFLGAEARTGDGHGPPGSATGPSEREATIAALRRFTSLHRGVVEGWHDRLSAWAAEGRQVALWGAGAKGVTFLNLVAGDGVATVIDVNPRKHGRHLAGTGHRVDPPEVVREARPDVVIVMNALYEREIADALRELGQDPAVVPV